MQKPYGGRANPGYTTTFDLNGSRVTPAAANGGHGLSAVGSDALVTQRRSIEERPGSFTRPPTLSRRVRRIRPNCCPPRGTRRPRNTNRGRPTHSNTRVTGRPSSSSGIIKGLLGSLPVGPPVASDLNPRVRGCSPRRTAFDGESGQPTVARLPEAPSRDIRDNDACAFMPTPAGPYKRSARVHPTSSHARSAATPVRRHHRRWSGLLRWTADAFMLDASRDQL